MSSVRTWYPTLIKPNWTPPAWVFGPVWTALYVLMAVAAWLIAKEPKSNARSWALILFGVQLILNGLWSFLFFGLKNPLLAFVELILLWIFLILTLIAFWRVRYSASLLLVPYFLWLSYALCLNAAIWMLNRS